MGYADYLGALQLYRNEHPHDTGIVQVSLYLLNYHFANRLFPNSLDAVEHTKQFGTPVILSDGDVVLSTAQDRKRRIVGAFRGNVLLYVHKEQESDAVEDQFPAAHYVMVDDKLRILDSMKKVWGSR